jgi:hypothetical protein
MNSSERTSDVFLNQMRQVADPLADDAVAELFAAEDSGALRALLATLRDNGDPIPEQFPPALQRYFEESAVFLDPREAWIVRAGERFFATHGPEIMLVLCCYSLPWDYSNKAGVQVLWRTGFLENRTNRRVAQTAQMIVDVMTPGGLGPRGRGVRSAQKVRLMHAAVRRLILNDPKRGWDAQQLGLPINQEDLAYTLMSFSTLVLDGLERLGLRIPDDQARAYFEAWRVVGSIMGLRPELIPDTLAEGRALGRAIHRRQVGSCREGRDMTNALVGLIEQVLGCCLDVMAPGLIRYFVGDSLAEVLGLRRRPIADSAVQAFAWASDLLDDFVEGGVARRVLFGRVSIRLIQHFIDATAPDAGSFELPDHLHEDWGVRKPS